MALWHKLCKSATEWLISPHCCPVNINCHISMLSSIFLYSFYLTDITFLRFTIFLTIGQLGEKAKLKVLRWCPMVPIWYWWREVCFKIVRLDLSKWVWHLIPLETEARLREEPPDPDGWRVPPLAHNELAGNETVGDKKHDSPKFAPFYPF